MSVYGPGRDPLDQFDRGGYRELLSGALVLGKGSYDKEALLDILECCEFVIHIEEETTVEDIVGKIEKYSSEWSGK